MNKANKIFIIILTIIVSAVFCLVTVTYGWFMQEATTTVDYNVDAVGYIIMDFDASAEQFNGKLAPAIAKAGAVADNLVDVNKIYRDGEVLPNFIVSGAKPLQYTTTLNYTDASSESGAELAHNFAITYQIHSGHAAGSTDYIVVGSGEADVAIAITIKGVTKNLVSGDIINVKGDTQIKFALTMYLTEVEELVDPKIIKDGIMLLISIKEVVVK